MLTKNSLARDFIIRATLGGPLSIGGGSISEPQPGKSEQRDASMSKLAGNFDILGLFSLYEFKKDIYLITEGNT